MQDTGKLVLGIDLCDDITQVTVMRPHAAEPDAVCFDARTRKEFLPTLLCMDQNGEWGIGEVISPEVTVLPQFFLAACKKEKVEFRERTYEGRELLEYYISLLMKKIRDRFESMEIGFVAVTCTEANTNEAVKDMLYDIFENSEGFADRCMVLSHLEAFLHYVIRQEESLWKNGSAVFDYGTEGLLFYRMDCSIAGGRRLLLADYTDYSTEIPPGFVSRTDTEQGALAFERLAGSALQKRVASLFVTGREFEGDWASDVLRLLSNGKRVFRGQNLYTQGACYAGTEEFREENNVDFSLLMPEQIDVDVMLLADNVSSDDGVYMARVGENYKKVNAEAEVILDTTDKLTFKITKAGDNVPVQIRVAPEIMRLRGDRTNRYAVRVFFAKRNMMVVQIKDTGFGEFYPSTYRIYEECVDFSGWEQ